VVVLAIVADLINPSVAAQTRPPELESLKSKHGSNRSLNSARIKCVRFQTNWASTGHKEPLFKWSRSQKVSIGIITPNLTVRHPTHIHRNANIAFIRATDHIRMTPITAYGFLMNGSDARVPQGPIRLYSLSHALAGPDFRRQNSMSLFSEGKPNRLPINKAFIAKPKLGKQ
jgi:hypothetical protein